ncbi:lipocalin family protein [Flavobacterium gyeonganense]|uniref:Lipocalin family protein n=1 Tax=Flavobacterium gyeonganense TaxID=1310418 RepID=A0ABV5HAF2_9FLAO|nr:lipocalin family protein [Flavobacterium gyeonganense]
MSVLTLGLSVASCSSDDDNDGGSASIEGKWELSQVGGIIGGKEMLEDAENGACSNDTYEFTNDGKFKETTYDSEDGKCEAETDNGTWTKNGNTLTIKYTGETQGDSYETEISGNKIKLKQTYSEGGMTFTSVYVYVKK